MSETARFKLPRGAVGAVIAMLISGSAVLAQDVALVGTIGPYPVEMELELTSEGTLAGRYRYEGRESWLDLTGEFFGGQAGEIVESVDGNETGRFYLGREDADLTGYWRGGESQFKAELALQSGTLDDLTHETGYDVSDALEGVYESHTYWVNDMWAPNSIEIGYNGGHVDVVARGAEQVQVDFRFIVGPTYHIADFSGVAKKTGPRRYEFNEVLPHGQEPCHLIFDFSDKALSITQHAPSFACGFGARAHAEFDLNKVSDTVPPRRER